MDETHGTVPTTILGTLWSWIGTTRLVVLAGALATTFSLIANADKCIPVVLRALDLPDCYSYANVYDKPGSSFRKEDAVWREYPSDGGAPVFTFREIQRTREHIDLLNLTERPNEPDWKNLMVRLPVCGGTARLMFPNRSLDLAEVWRGKT